jgi:hypothetical protein
VVHAELAAEFALRRQHDAAFAQILCAQLLTNLAVQRASDD